jgi:hypothetical protein
MGWKLLAGFVIVLILAAGGLAVYGARVQPQQHSLEQVLPDQRFPK